MFTSKKGILSQMKARTTALHVGLLAGALCWTNGGLAQAQTRSTASHGKTGLDSYNKLLRDVHPASQAQANYLQNLLYLNGLKKAERLERWERIDVYGERRLIKKLENYDSIAKRLSAGSPTSAISLNSFWVVVSVFGDRAEVYDALSSEVPPIAHDQFVPTLLFMQMVEPNRELVRPPLLLLGCEDADASKFQLAWRVLAKNMQANSKSSARDVAEFYNGVAAYREQCALAIPTTSPVSGRLQADRYLRSLGSLADALYRPQQYAQIQQYVAHGGNYFYGGNLLGLIQHMLRNSVTPAQGSTAQVALAEVARPISRVLEQEIALHYERIDSLAGNEGHRPYAAEYRRHEAPSQAAPARKSHNRRQRVMPEPKRTRPPCSRPAGDNSQQPRQRRPEVASRLGTPLSFGMSDDASGPTLSSIREHWEAA